MICLKWTFQAYLVNAPLPFRKVNRIKAAPFIRRYIVNLDQNIAPAFPHPDFRVRILAKQCLFEFKRIFRDLIAFQFAWHTVNQFSGCGAKVFDAIA
jgi:hypothetical protein